MQTGSEGAMCANCKRSPVQKTGRCGVCYNYFRRTGEERPPHLYERDYLGKKSCSNCGRSLIHAKGRCAACYAHWVATGTERRSRRTRTHQQMKWCKRCGGLQVYAFNRCVTCYRYRRKHGKDRPKYLFDDNPCCGNCGIPLRTLISGSGKRTTSVKGVCEPCYNYKRRFGKERPRHLWGAGEHGWCDCGYPAIALVDGDIPVCNRHKE